MAINDRHGKHDQAPPEEKRGGYVSGSTPAPKLRPPATGVKKPQADGTKKAS